MYALTIKDVDQMLLKQNGAGVLIGGHAFDSKRRFIHKDIDLLLFRGQLPDDELLDVFTLRQLIPDGDTCWVNDRGFALDFSIDPDTDELPDGLWHPNQAALESMRTASVHLWYKYRDAIVVPEAQAAMIYRQEKHLPVRVDTIYGDTRHAFSLVFMDWESDPDEAL